MQLLASFQGFMGDFGFPVLTLIGGLCLFMFGMNIMGESLERAAGNKLQSLLAKFTTNTNGISKMNCHT